MGVEGLRDLDLILTSGCNLACSYCYQTRAAARRMPWPILRSAVSLLLRPGDPDRRAILFTGGEPLLEFPSLQRAVELAEARRPPGVAIEYRLTTNGLQLGDRVAGFLERHRVHTQLSLDGLPAAQARRGPGTFQRLDRLLGRLRTRRRSWFDRQLRIAVTVLPSTLPTLADSIRYLIDTGVREICLSPLMTHDPSWCDARIDELDRALGEVFDVCLEHWGETGELPVSLFRPPAPEGGSSPRSMMCGVAGRWRLCVDVDGQVYGCGMFAGSLGAANAALLARERELMRLGALDSPELSVRWERFRRAIRDSPVFKDPSRKRSSHGRCDTCPSRDDCLICPVSIAWIPSNTDPDRIPDFTCAFQRLAGEYRRRFPHPPLLARAAAVGAPPRLVRRILANRPT